MALVIGEIFSSGAAPVGLPSLNMVTSNGSGIVRGFVSGVLRPLLGFDHTPIVNSSFILNSFFTPYPLLVFGDFCIQRATRIPDIVNKLTKIWQSNGNNPPSFKPPLTELEDLTYSDYLDNSGFPDKLILFNCAKRNIDLGASLASVLNQYQNFISNFFHIIDRGTYAFSNPIFVINFVRTEYLRPFLIENNILNPNFGLNSGLKLGTES